MGLDLSGNGSPETVHVEGDRNLAVGLYRVGNNSVVDHRNPLHCVIVLTDVMSDHIGRGQRQNHIVGTCRLTQFEGGLNLLHEADDGAVM